MLSKEKPVSYRYIALPGREEERVLLWVEFERYIFCCTHLSLTPEDRMLSLPILRREAAFAHKPLFIAGIGTLRRIPPLSRKSARISSY